MRLAGADWEFWASGSVNGVGLVCGSRARRTAGSRFCLAASKIDSRLADRGL